MCWVEGIGFGEIGSHLIRSSPCAMEYHVIATLRSRLESAIPNRRSVTVLTRANHSGNFYQPKSGFGCKEENRLVMSGRYLSRDLV
jgi:hypothetical protein